MCYATCTPSVTWVEVSGVKIAHSAVWESGGSCGKFSTRVGKTWTSWHPIARRCGIRQAGRCRSPYVGKGTDSDAEQHRSHRLPPQSRTRRLELTPPSSPPESSILTRIIHDDSAASADTRLRRAVSPFSSSTYCTSMPQAFTAPSARLASCLHAFATNLHE